VLGEEAKKPMDLTILMQRMTIPRKLWKLWKGQKDYTPEWRSF
jgi:hypothetical protein